MAKLVAEVESKHNGASRDFAQSAQEVETQIEKMTHDAGRKIGTMAAEVSDATAAYMKTSREYVKAHPKKSLAFAAAIGAVIGGIFGATMARRK